MTSSSSIVVFVCARHNSMIPRFVSEAVSNAGGIFIPLEESLIEPKDIDTINDRIGKAAVVIVDLTEPSPNVMLAIGIAQASGKPLLPITAKIADVPTNLASVRVLIYGDISIQDFKNRLTAIVREVLLDPKRFDYRSAVEQRKRRQCIFISYSHKDREFLDRLLIHLQPLQKKGLVNAWADTQLRAGDRWKEEIQKALSKATVAILIVSADFLASDFIVDNELPPLLRAAEERGTRIIPLIAKPCRFTRDENLKHFQAINDPNQALVLLGYGDQERVYDTVGAEVERQIQKG